MATGTAFGRIYRDERVIRCTRVYYAPRCVCNFGRKGNDLKARGFHERQLNPTRDPRIGEIQARNSVAAPLWEARRRPQGDGYNYGDKNSTTTRVASATIAA